MTFNTVPLDHVTVDFPTEFVDSVTSLMSPSTSHKTLLQKVLREFRVCCILIQLVPSLCLYASLLCILSVEKTVSGRNLSKMWKKPSGNDGDTADTKPRLGNELWFG